MRFYLFLMLCVAAALLPFMTPEVRAPELTGFPGWPTTFMGEPVHEVPMSDKERQALRGFPGRVARLEGSHVQVVIRWIVVPTRQLHPVADCLKGDGYTILADEHRTDPVWKRTLARRGQTEVTVLERIWDTEGHSWSDVSAWYWSTVLGQTHAPWWSATVALKA